MKRASLYLAAICMLLTGCLTGCVGKDPENQGKEENTMPYMLKQTDAGYVAEFSAGGKTWRTDAGAIGVRTIRANRVRPGEEEFFAYTSVVSDGDQTVASAEVETLGGTRLSVEDRYCVDGGDTVVSRDIRVLEKSAKEVGFLVTFAVRDTAEGRAEVRKWFAPGAMYGNDEVTMLGTSNRIAFDGEESIAPVDSLSMPFIFNYADNDVFCLEDQTEGHRQTVAEDYGADVSKAIVSADVNLPGIGFRNVAENGKTCVEMFHSYPAQTQNFGNREEKSTVWRMLPAEEGLQRTVRFRISQSKADTFRDAVGAAVHQAFDRYAVVDSRYDPAAVRKVLLQAVYDSFGVVNGIPQFMTNTDHFLPESGFLFRNVDLGYLLLAEGRRTGNQAYIDRALLVINDQVRNDRIEAKRVDAYERYTTEGLINLLFAIEVEASYGIKHDDWESYLHEKARPRLKSDDPIVFPLLTDMAAYTGESGYLAKAEEMGEQLLKDHSQFRYISVLYEKGNFTARESGCVYLDAYLDLYQLTEDAKWLDAAELTADFILSTVMVQTIDMQPIGITGLEQTGTGQYPNRGYLGNAHLHPYGLSWVASTTNTADIYAVYSAPDLQRLSKFTGKTFYADMAAYLQYNTSIYFNMGDKLGMMDDMLHNAPMGFTNEYFGLSCSLEDVITGRGDVHDSNLGWCMYVQLYSYERMLGLTGGYLPTESDRAYDVAKFKTVTASSQRNGVYRAWNAVDKDANTVWLPAEDDRSPVLTVALGEPCDLTAAAIVSDAREVQLSLSVDGDVWETVDLEYADGMFSWSQAAARTAAFARVKVVGDGGVSDIRLIGLPVTFDVLSDGATVTLSAGGDGAAVCDRNYDTGTAVSAGGTLTLDLGQVCDVATVALALSDACEYTVSISVDGTTYNRFATGGTPAKLVWAHTGYAQARYVRVRFTKGTNVTLNEFRILGRERRK